MRHFLPRAAASCARPERRRGFTLIELLITIAIAGILAAIAAPAFQSIFVTMRLSAYANDLVATSMLARSTAISQNAVVSMCPSSDGATCSDGGGWENGYLIVCQSNDGAVCSNAPSTTPSTIVLHRQAKAAAGWRVIPSEGVSSIVFQPTGSGSTTASLTICRSLPSPGTNERIVRISPTGRASVTKTTTGSCS